VSEQIAVLVKVQRWSGTVGQSAASAFSRPAAPSAMSNSGVLKLRATRSSRSVTSRLALAAHVADRQ